MKIWLNPYMLLGAIGPVGENMNVVGLEYPESSGIEHLLEGAIWIGAIIDTGKVGNRQQVKLVTTSNLNRELCPVNTENPWRFKSILNGDFDAISESDYYCEAVDTINIYGHVPLGVKVALHSYAWAQLIREPILPIEYYFINLGRRELKNIFIGIFLQPGVFHISTSGSPETNNIIGYWPEIKTAYVCDPKDPNITPIGFTILGIPKTLDVNNFSFRWTDNSAEWFGFFPGTPLYVDSFRYNVLSGEAFNNEPRIKPNPNDFNLDLYDILFSIGPLNNWAIGETLKLSFAVVSGYSLKYTQNNIYENATRAHTLYARNYYPPVTPPSPKLRIEQGEKKITLHWGYDGTGINPMEVWDEKSLLAESYPPDHWRRKNPPPGKTTGGRIFEGFRLYRSEDPMGSPKSFTLLAQWDVKDSVGERFEYDTGIETTYVDTNLQIGKTYWYSVTSFGIPDMNRVFDYVDFDGSIKKETLYTKSTESSLLASRKRAKLTFAPSYEVGKVKVVPNPYRVDEDYTLEMGGYEGRARVWNENKRLLKFIHLPPKCTIRIYTIAGEIIATLHHEDETRGEIDWNMLSESHRTIASGVYVYTVESEYGTQIGKFVVIR